MALYTQKGIKIAGIAGAVPKNVIHLSDFAATYGEENVRRVQKMTGIREFRVTSKYQTAGDLGYAAAKETECGDRFYSNFGFCFTSSGLQETGYGVCVAKETGSE